MRTDAPAPGPEHTPDEARTIRLPDAPSDLAEALARGGAVAWEEPVTIRTYESGEPSVHPMYFDHRVYQGSSGRVYPLPFVEHVSDEARDRPWQAVHLENAHVRLMLLPELGGRIHVGLDKATGYDFFYRNNVIKPALVGLGGPWISGGVEFNWPQHHRPGTYLPVETRIERDDDGSVTVWCHDHEPFERMSAHHGIRLRPESSVVEAVVRLHNRTSLRQSFLWWANVAAYVGDDYQSFFPEDVHHVADHARRAITAFPAADREYYGVDYAARGARDPGSDRIDRYHNIPVPTSYMVVDSQGDFFGGYDHTAGAGVVHWAERRVSPGKKMWTWGDAPFGHAWDAQLTDSDGPYVELMAGVHTDNQPDFSWLLPGETKVFSQFWYPIPNLGPAHAATPDAAVNVRRDGAVVASFAVTSHRRNAELVILRDGRISARRVVDMAPGVVARIEEEAAGDGSPSVELRSADGSTLVRWTAQADDERPEPEAADEPPSPADTATVEELYLTGLHLSQYRHPTRSPLPYWTEALRRDPGDVRTNLALAERELRVGNYAAAEALARTALARLTRRNANPTDTEAFYLLGLTLRRQQKLDEAEQALGKAGWDGTWAAAAGFELAQLLAHRGRNRAALRVLETLDGVVGHDPRRAGLRTIVLRRLGRLAEADRVLERALAEDPLDATSRVLAGRSRPTDAGVLLDVGFELLHAGDATGALALFEEVVAAPSTAEGNFRPVAGYAAASVLDLLGRSREAEQHREHAGRDLRRAFPNGLDALDVLTAAVERDPADPVAKHLLGMLHYHHGRRTEAMALWGSAIDLGLEHPVLLRNAGLAAYNVAGDDDLAWRLYERAVAADPDDARIRYEQDQLAIRLGHDPATRLERLAGSEPIVLTRDDFTIEYVTLLAGHGDARRAHEILTGRRFHPWEGGEGKAVAAWDETLRSLGLAPADPPANLGEARPRYTAPAPVRDDGVTDYFATSLPDLLLFSRE
ncbi:DUF5107 domain-containing protein [Tessaracoccus rhinocerotis]|uniref:DUF5107 domain-containing protein n=1 Tax=Tessaracoccus rhinocerotis TaxID=1689449 RepID=A0A553JXB4_9ACTN|nr:DUF5107 domain-containing protein [Tessaracoccus rhinocerotis]TRY17086.1 DUF5107 domain-containing protein [Tessaracoccus rhinocerotis]